MKRRLQSLAIATPLIVASALAWAQATVYESRDKAGPTFSDKPSPGAVPVDVPAPNVVAVPKPAAVAPPVAASAPPYRSLVFVSLAAGGTVHSNTGEFEFSVRSVPALRQGDRLRVRLDGSLLPGSYRSTNLRVSEGDWQRAARGESALHQLQVAIEDGQGAVVMTSEPIAFYVQRAAVGGKRR